MGTARPPARAPDTVSKAQSDGIEDGYQSCRCDSDPTADRGIPCNEKEGDACLIGDSYPACGYDEATEYRLQVFSERWQVSGFSDRSGQEYCGECDPARPR